MGKYSQKGLRLCVKDVKLKNGIMEFDRKYGRGGGGTIGRLGWGSVVVKKI